MTPEEVSIIEKGFINIGKREAYIRVGRFIADNIDGSSKVTGLEVLDALMEFLRDERGKL